MIVGSAENWNITGSTLTYTLRLVNLSPNTAYNAALSTFVPAGTTFSSVRSTLGRCQLGEATVKVPTLITCSLGSIGGSGVVTITLTVGAKGGAGTISDSATVTSTLNPNANNNTFNISAVM